MELTSYEWSPFKGETMFRKSIAAALLCTALSITSAQAQTQPKYFSRSKLTIGTQSATTPATPKTLACGTPVQNYWNDNTSATNLSTTTVASAAEAAAWCNAQLSTRPGLSSASCSWTSASNSAYVQTNSNVVRRTDNLAYLFWSTTCS